MRQRSQDLDSERQLELWLGCGPAEVLLQPVQDQSVLDFLGLPDIGVEGLVGVIGVWEQHEQLQHIAINFQLDSGEVVDHMPELSGYQPGSFDRAIDRIQWNRRIELTQALHMLSELLLGDVLPGHSRHFRCPSCVKHCGNCVPYTVKLARPNRCRPILERYSERSTHVFGRLQAAERSAVRHARQACSPVRPLNQEHQQDRNQDDGGSNSANDSRGQSAGRPRLGQLSWLPTRAGNDRRRRVRGERRQPLDDRHQFTEPTRREEEVQPRLIVLLLQRSSRVASV